MLDVTSGFGRAARYPICAPALIAHLRFQSPRLHKPLPYPDVPCWKKKILELLDLHMEAFIGSQNGLGWKRP